jgi:effector-associated domain 1 (EAD1)-containing protein
MKLQEDQRTRLLKALKDVFSTKEQVEELTLQAINRSVDQISLASDLSAVLLKIITTAEDEGWIGNLVDAAIVLRPASQDLSTARAELNTIITAEREDHYAACWLLGDRVMVNRTMLRKALCRLSQPETGKHILVVQGPELSGKSHSLQLVRYLEERRGGFKLIWTDLFRLAAGAESRLVLPQDLGQALVDQIGLTGMPARENEKDERWVQRFCDWLTGQLATKNIDYWIVIDSFSKTLLPEGTHGLIRELALRIETNLGRLRLILLSYTDTDNLPPEVFGGLEEEPILGPIQQIGKSELLAFFGKLYEERKRRQNTDFEPDDIAESVAKVLREVDPNNARFLSLLSRAIIKEGRQLRTAGGQP